MGLCWPTAEYILFVSMATAKVFKHGNSQAVRLPKEFRVEGDEVEVARVGRVIVLRPKKLSCSKRSMIFPTTFLPTPSGLTIINVVSRATVKASSPE